MGPDCDKVQEQTSKCPHADESADRAVEKTFAMMGVNIHDPESVSGFQQDLRFNRTVRRISDKINITIIVVIVAAMTTGTIALIWDKITK